jgi:hypothetical protein
MRFDRADISGALPIDGFVDLAEYAPLEAARMIVERARVNALPLSPQ